MCGRYTLSQVKRLEEMYERQSELKLTPRYNVAPTQTAPIITDAHPNQLIGARWGLVPSWAKDGKTKYPMHNAKAETVEKMPAYRSAFKRQRCLVPADGFYEWKQVAGGKQPHRFLVGDGDLYYFAGLWEVWKSEDGKELRSFTIVTTEPNELVKPVHDRMPVILPAEAVKTWLGSDASPETLKGLLRPYPAKCMRAELVSSRVNSARNDDPSLIEPVAGPEAAPAGNDGATLDSE